MLERKIAVHIFNILYVYTLLPPIDFKCVVTI